MKEPKEIQIDRVDVLQLENFQLKISAVVQQKDLLVEDQTEFISVLNEKYGVSDIKKYMMNTATGKCKLMEAVNG